MEDLKKEFKPSTWSINNRTAIFILTVILLFAGVSTYNSLPKESFPNISGNYDLARLKKYADDAKERLESMKEVKQVDIIGALEREIQVNVDMLKLQGARLTMYDIYNAVKNENATIPGGSVSMDGVRR